MARRAGTGLGVGVEHAPATNAAVVDQVNVRASAGRSDARGNTLAKNHTSAAWKASVRKCRPSQTIGVGSSIARTNGIKSVAAASRTKSPNAHARRSPRP
jgi:hypothetical protein